MNFQSGINRPPYETADGYLQITEGCSHNRCLFCTYFKNRKFKKTSIEEIETDIKEIPQNFGAPKRIFLQGADAFAADYDILMKTAELIHKYVPSVQSIGGYARIDNFYDKSEEQLRILNKYELYSHKIDHYSYNFDLNSFISDRYSFIFQR